MVYRLGFYVDSLSMREWILRCDNELDVYNRHDPPGNLYYSLLGSDAVQSHP